MSIHELAHAPSAMLDADIACPSHVFQPEALVAA